MKFIEDQAEEEVYECVSLSSGLQREDAHRFYEENIGYDKRAMCLNSIYERNNVILLTRFNHFHLRTQSCYN